MFGASPTQLITLVVVVVIVGIGRLQRKRAEPSMTEEERTEEERTDLKRRDLTSSRSYLRFQTILLGFLGVVVIAAGEIWGGIAAIARPRQPPGRLALATSLGSA